MWRITTMIVALSVVVALSEAPPSAAQFEPDVLEPELVAQQLRRVRRAYQQGDFNVAFTMARAVRQARFERKGDVWVFRRDELNRLFALSAYCLELTPAFLAEIRRQVADPAPLPRYMGRHAVHSFGYALAASPEAVAHASRAYPLPAELKPAFALAQQFCVMPGGFHSREPDEYCWV